MVDPKGPLPNTPKAFGQELRRLRENAGVSIDDLINETKVTRSVFEGLEAGRFQFLPERVFSRNFVRQYAHYVGAEVDRVMEAFDIAWNSFIVSSGSHPAILVAEPPPRTLIKWQYWIPVSLAALVIIVISLMMIRGGEPNEELSPDPRRSMATVPAPTSFPSPLISSPFPQADEPTALTGTASEETVVVVLIAVKEGKECWIHYRDRDGRVDQRLLQGGDTLDLELAGPAHLSIGNAGAVSVQVGDQDYSNLGQPGQVIHCEVSAEGLQLLGA